MKRHTIPVREDWQKKVESLGFNFHTLAGETYWDERAYYEFNYGQVAVLEKATHEIYAMCLRAVDHILRNNLLDLFFVPPQFWPLIHNSWNSGSPSIYGRFDLSWNGDASMPPKMLEFNADTPTSLFEAGVVQWFWLQDFSGKDDQFNSVHEKLIEGWRKIKHTLKGKPLYFSCLPEFPEDQVNVSYLQDCALQAGIPTMFISVHDIGRSTSGFIDIQGNPIHHIFKLYPWEWMINEEFGQLLGKMDTVWIEPFWKMILSNKAILPVLWKLFPGHPNLLECYFDHPGPMRSYAIKPLLSREGANVTLVEDGKTIGETFGDYGEEGFIYQKLQKLPNMDGNFPVIGSWVIDGQPAGIGIRETSSLVTDNFSRFIPHLISKS
jgi:glutathionylspermidine synthase